MATTSRPPLPVRSAASSAPGVWMPSFSAVRGLTYAMLSHVILERGFGSSWSQPLLEKRPSRTFGSGRNTISIPVGVGGAVKAIGADVMAGSAGPPFTLAAGLVAVLGPSVSAPVAFLWNP